MTYSQKRMTNSKYLRDVRNLLVAEEVEAVAVAVTVAAIEIVKEIMRLCEHFFAVCYDRQEVKMKIGI